MATPYSSESLNPIWENSSDCKTVHHAFFFAADRCESAASLLAQLHWLPVRQRIQFKVALLIFKCLHHTAPQYLHRCIQLHVSGRFGLRSCCDSTLLSEHRSKNTNTDKAFTTAGPKLWNSKPSRIRTLDTVLSFKNHLKTHLFPVTL